MSTSEDAPNEAQALFLDRIMQRCHEEHKDFRAAGALVAQNTRSLSEPVRACLLGIPGAGKSHCIKLLRRLFEACLGWADGVQFQFLAQQNTMAALIGGKTVNTWRVIPINPEAAASKRQGKGKDGDIDELFMNAVGMRWLIIDECSTISPYSSRRARRSIAASMLASPTQSRWRAAPAFWRNEHHIRR